ncbi:hypothetical protein FQR65_LT17887 [Abscondita terminalis]|nr:hypothetical protein FQR65_LT17887 [Abscondita terminalis]
MIKPDIHISTAEAYANVYPRVSDVNLKEAVRLPVQEWKFLIGNDFEDGLFERYPLIKSLKEACYESGAIYASMSGSGSSAAIRKGVLPDRLKYPISQPRVDVVTGGFPCQAFSYAGKRLGFEDARGTLFYEFARVVKDVNPPICIGENVKGLLSHDNGKTLQGMISILDEIGYNVFPVEVFESDKL